MTIQAYAATEEKADLSTFEYELDEIGPDHVDIDVEYCGICHSDLSMIDGDWGQSSYPLVPGHEISGKVAAIGDRVTHLKVGQKVGLGWYSQSCMTCHQCMSGDHNLCADAEGTIVGRHGGFANRVRSHAAWASSLPDSLDPAKVGPLFCGGITVFNPIVQNGISPMDRVGVVGIGGLGHMALGFLNAWGCEVTAFSHSPEKEDEAKALGAHHFVDTSNSGALDKVDNRYDMILVTVNVELDWSKYIALLAPKGKLHFVGAAPSVSSEVFPLITGQKSIGGSPLGSPATVTRMLDFAARHEIAPKIEEFPMSRVNEALEKLRTDSPAARLVLKADF